MARTLLGWGVRHITLVDSGARTKRTLAASFPAAASPLCSACRPRRQRRVPTPTKGNTPPRPPRTVAGNVSFSNPVRQWLFDLSDCLDGGKPKAEAAAAALVRIFPGAKAEGVRLSIPMPGHFVPAADEAAALADADRLADMVRDHDLVFLLTDTRESRWLPTLLCASEGRTAVTAALGFDSYLVMRHGAGVGPDAEAAPEGGRLGCYFCNDVVRGACSPLPLIPSSFFPCGRSYVNARGPSTAGGSRQLYGGPDARPAVHRDAPGARARRVGARGRDGSVARARPAGRRYAAAGRPPRRRRCRRLFLRRPADPGGVHPRKPSAPGAQRRRLWRCPHRMRCFSQLLRRRIRRPRSAASSRGGTSSASPPRPSSSAPPARAKPWAPSAPTAGGSSWARSTRLRTWRTSRGSLSSTAPRRRRRRRGRPRRRAGATRTTSNREPETLVAAAQGSSSS